MRSVASARPRTRSPQKCYLCLRYKPLPMCPEWTHVIGWPRAELNHRHTDFQSVDLVCNFIALSTAYGVRAPSPSQSNAVQCKGMQNYAATFLYTGTHRSMRAACPCCET